MLADAKQKTYSIGEAAAQTNTTVHTLRYYEDIGLLPPITRDSSGHRAYTEEDLGWVWWARMLRGSGMSIQMMQEYVALSRNGYDSIAARCAILDDHRQTLRDRIAELEGYLAVLDDKVAFYRGLEHELTDTAD